MLFAVAFCLWALVLDSKILRCVARGVQMSVKLEPHVLEIWSLHIWSAATYRRTPVIPAKVGIKIDFS
jgi:hypothetical protein